MKMDFLRIKIDWLSKTNMLFTANILNKYLEVREAKYFNLSFIYLNKSNKKKRESFLKTFLVPTIKCIVKNNYNEKKRKEIQINSFISNRKQIYKEIYLHKEIYLPISFHHKNKEQIQKKEYIERSISVLLKKFYQERILFSKENKKRMTEILFYSTYYEEGKEKLMLLLEYSNLIEKEKQFFMEQIKNRLFSVQSADQIVSRIQQGSISKKQLQEFFINMEQLFLEEQKKQVEYNINSLEKEQIQILLENKAFFLEMIQEETNDIVDKTMDQIREYNLFPTQRKIISVQKNTKSEIEKLIFYVKNSNVKEYKQFIHSILKIEVDKVKQIDDKSISIKEQKMEETPLNHKIEDKIQEIDLSLYYQEQTKKLFQKISNFYKKYETYKENTNYQTYKENEKSKIETTQEIKENTYKKIVLEIEQIIHGIIVKRDNITCPVIYKWNKKMGIILKVPVPIKIQTNKEKERLEKKRISKEYNKLHFLKDVKHVTFPNITLEQTGENDLKTSSMLERLNLYYGMESQLNYSFYKRIENEYIKYKEKILEQKIVEKSNLLAKKINLECTRKELENQVNDTLTGLVQAVITNSQIKKIRNKKLMQEQLLLEKDDEQQKIIKEIMITAIEKINKQFIVLKDKKTEQIDIQTEKEIKKELEQLLYQILEKNIFLYRKSRNRWKQKEFYITEMDKKEQKEIILEYEKLEKLKKKKNLDISLEAMEVQNFIKENTYKLATLLQNEKNRDENNTMYHNLQLISEELFLLYVRCEQIEEKKQKGIQQLLTIISDKKEEIDKNIVIKKEEIEHQIYCNFNSFANEIVTIQSCYKTSKERIEKKSRNLIYNVKKLIIQDKRKQQERILYQIKNQLKEKVEMESFRWKKEIKEKNKTKLEIAVKDYFYQLIKEVIKLEREVVEGVKAKQKGQEENRQTKIVEEKKQIEYQQNKIVDNKQEEIQISTWYQNEIEKKIPRLVETLIKSNTEQEMQKQIYQFSLEIIKKFLEQKEYKKQFNIQKISLCDVIKNIEQVQDNIELNFFNKNLYKQIQEITIDCIKEIQEKVIEEANNFKKVIRKSYNKEEIKKYIEDSFYRVSEEVIKIYIKNKIKKIENKKDENEKIENVDNTRKIKKLEEMEYEKYLLKEQIDLEIKNEIRKRIEIQENKMERFLQENKKLYIDNQLQQFSRELIKTIFDYEIEKELKKQIDQLKTIIIKNTDQKTEMYYLIKRFEQNLLTYRQNIDINQQKTNLYSLERKNIIYKKNQKFSKYSINLEHRKVLQKIIKKRLENQNQLSLFELQQNKRIQKKVLEKSNLKVKENTKKILNLYKDKFQIEKNRNKELKKIVCYMNQKIEEKIKESSQEITKNIIQIYMMYEIKNQVNNIPNVLSNELLKKFTIYQKAQIVNQVKQLSCIATGELIKKTGHKKDSRHNSLEHIMDNLSEWILRQQIHFDHRIANTDIIIKNQKRKKEIQKNVEKLVEDILYQQNEKREKQYNSKIKNSRLKDFQNINTFYYNMRYFFEEMHVNFDKEETNIKNYLKQKNISSTQEFIKDAKLFYRLISMGTEETAKQTFDWIIKENLFQNSRRKKRKQKEYNVKQKLCYLIQNATREEYQEFVMHLAQDREIKKISNNNKKYDIQEKPYQKNQFIRQQYDINQQEKADLTYVKQYDLNKQEKTDLTYINQYNVSEQEKTNLTYIKQNYLNKEDNTALEYKNQEYYLQQKIYEIKQKNILNWKEQYEQQWNVIKKIYNEWTDKTKKEIEWNIYKNGMLYKQIELQPIFEQLLKNNIFFSNKDLKKIGEKQIYKNNIQTFKSKNTKNNVIRHTKWKNRKYFLEYLERDNTKELYQLIKWFKQGKIQINTTILETNKEIRANQKMELNKEIERNEEVEQNRKIGLSEGIKRSRGIKINQTEKIEKKENLRKHIIYFIQNSSQKEYEQFLLEIEHLKLKEKCISRKPYLIEHSKKLLNKDKKIRYKQNTIFLNKIIEQNRKKEELFFNNIVKIEREAIRQRKAIEKEKEINLQTTKNLKQNNFVLLYWNNSLDPIMQSRKKVLLEKGKNKQQRDEKSETDDLRKKVNESQKKVMEHTKIIKQLQKELEEQKKIILKTKEVEQKQKETILKNKIITKEVIQALEWKLDMEKVSRGLD